MDNSNNTKNESNLIRKRSYIVELEEFSNGNTNFRRTNDGFDALQLLGILDFIRDEVVKQIKGEIKPDVIQRNVIKDDN